MLYFLIDLTLLPFNPRVDKHISRYIPSEKCVRKVTSAFFSNQSLDKIGKKRRENCSDKSFERGRVGARCSSQEGRTGVQQGSGATTGPGLTWIWGMLLAHGCFLNQHRVQRGQVCEARLLPRPLLLLAAGRLALHQPALPGGPHC